MGKTSRRTRADAGNRLAIVGLVALAVVTAGLVTAAVAPRSSEASTYTAQTFAPEPTAEPTTPTIESADLAAAAARLQDPDVGFTMTVLGDSTGNDPDEWVGQLARSLNTDYSRTVLYNGWDAAAGAYAPATLYQGSYSSQPVTIWNGSAAGMGPDYSLANLATLAPQPSDLLIVNHGHNFDGPNTGSGQEAELVTATAAQWQTTPAVAITLQNPRITTGEKQDANLATLASTFADSGYTLVDVASAFRAQPDLAAVLREDGTHPNEAGQALWIDTVRGVLGL